MSAFEKFGGGLLIGVAAGVGAALIGPALWRLGRPVAKDAIKASVAGYGAARVALARASEEVEDLVAEASHELSEAAAATAATVDDGVISRG